MYKYILLFIFTLTSILAVAQNYTTEQTASKRQQKLYREAEQLAFRQNYQEALKNLDKLLSKDPAFIDALILRGQIAYDQNALAKARQDFDQTLNLDADYNDIVRYMLGITEWKLDKFTEAIAHLEAYLATNPDNSFRKTNAQRYLNNARFAAKAIQNPVPFEPKSLGDGINTEQPEILPTLTADESMLFYTTLINGQQDILMSVKKNGVWQPGILLKGVSSPRGDEASPSISANGKVLVFTACGRKDGYGSCDLYYSEVRNGQWTAPKNMGSTINTKSWESQPSISSDGRFLFFASERGGGKGAKDLWVSIRAGNGEWTTPQNLGATVNTSADEQAPFIHADGRTLYFMSKGHPGMGEFDLYRTTLQEDGTFTSPENLGYPINSKANEGALSVSLDGQTAYFDSDRNLLQSEGNVTNNDIQGTDLYSFELYPAMRPQPVTYVRASVTNAETNRILSEAEVEFIDLATGEVYRSSLTDWDGEFLTVLPVGKNYALNVRKPGFVFHSENFALRESYNAADAFELEIALQPIPETVAEVETVEPKSKPVILKNIFFETASAQLRPESRTELESLQNLLDENPQLRIQINGHTDNVGSEIDNQQLSEARAEAVYQFLVENGIVAERLRFKGFGESQPIASNDTPEGRQRNRRTEFVVW